MVDSVAKIFRRPAIKWLVLATILCIAIAAGIKYFMNSDDPVSHSVVATIPFTHEGDSEGALDVDGGRLFVSTGASIDVIDTHSNKLLTTITNIGYPSNLLWDPSTKTLYAGTMDDDPSGSYSRSIVAIDPTSGNVKSVIPVSAYSMAISPDAHRLYSYQYKTETISIIDTRSNEVIGTLPGNSGPWYHDPDAGLLVASTADRDGIQVINTTTGAVDQTVIHDGLKGGVAFSADKRQIYLASVDTNAVEVIDRDSGDVVPIPVDNASLRPIVEHNGLLYAADVKAPRLYVIDPKNRTLRATLNTPSIPFGLTMNRSTDTLFVLMSDSSRVSAIDTKSLQITDTMEVGFDTKRIILDTTTNTIYAISGKEGVTVIGTGPKRKPSPTVIAPPDTNPLPAPSPLSPTDGAVYSGSQTSVEVKWSSVDGAASYGVELQYQNSSDGEWWGTPTNGSIVKDLHETSYSFAFRGAQPHRWRVYAIDARGTLGPPSDWSIVSYEP